MSEGQQRAICRALFLACALLPLAVVLWLMLGRDHESACRDAIQTRFGLSAEIDSIVTPRPGTTTLKDVRLSDFASGQEIEVSHIEILKGRDGESRLVVPSLNLSADQLAMLIDRLQRVMPKHLAEARLSMEVRKLTIEHRKTESGQTLKQELHACVLHSVPTDKGSSRFTFDFTLPESLPKSMSNVLPGSSSQSQSEVVSAKSATASRRCNITVKPLKNGNSQFTIYRLQTNGNRLPCWMFRQWSEQLALLGDDCTFSGDVVAGGGLLQVTNGRLQNVDLQRLIADSFSYGIDGIANIEIDECLSNRNGFQKIRGRLDAQPGSDSIASVDRRLINAAQEHLQLSVPADRTSASVPYSQCAFEFVGDSTQFHVRGNSPGNVIIVDRQGRAVLASNGTEAHSYVDLLHTFIPATSVDLFRRPQCRQLLTLLPGTIDGPPGSRR